MKLNLNNEGQNTLLLNVTNTVPNTLAQSFEENKIYTNKDNTNKIQQSYATNFNRQCARRMRFCYTRSSSDQQFFNFALAFPTNQIVHQNLVFQRNNALNILYSDPYPSTGAVPTGEGYYKILKMVLILKLSIVIKILI
ncbi:hypothetical protein SAMN02745150_00727 [Brevinema andersonii]|uniref:Uncharacterized protein n=1 Tax=Brevinema andersonii TaxID=34097 RepID=A0A1I1DWL4_BREAD|nr:hypothetical protein [Brevinema andersonii]SFB77100.1 hypothetical protein SAMN02745150_00727 [Brevinema andersonii]